MTFRIGQPVICIDSKGACCLKTGRTYICLGVEPDFLRVDCCPLPEHQDHCGWFSIRFRPVVDKKTDISFAHEILRKATRTKESVNHG